MSKTVCIVGAGPSGLVAAKTLLHNTAKNAFKVTIFEAQPRIGGLWPSHPGDVDGLVHPNMVVNQSRHTMQFSDLAWEAGSPQFPPAWMVGRYLDKYRKAYCDVELLLRTKVLGTRLNPDSTWSVLTLRDGQQETRQFDYLLVSSGFFGAPQRPSLSAENSPALTIHSSDYRTLDGLLSKGAQTGGKLLVVGGQMSGVETAATMASHLSSALHSPHPCSVENIEKYEIHHIIQRPVWVLPLFTTPEPKSSKPRFLPIDINSADLSKRSRPLVNTQGHISAETAKLVNSHFRSSLGTDQSEFSPLLGISSEHIDEPPYIAISDSYTEFVRSGQIGVSCGKLKAVDGTTAILDTGTTVSDVAAIVLATGFQASDSLGFLPEDVLDRLCFSAEHASHPVALAFHNTHHPDLPSLGFVGYYRGPYWGILEMQARFVAALWSGRASSPSVAAALAKDNSIDRALSLRKDPRCSQFPMGDYVFIMDQFAAALDLKMSGLPEDLPPPSIAPGKVMDIAMPSRYAPFSESPERDGNNAASIKDTNTTVHAALDSNRFLARAVFRSLLGTWTLDRKLKSKLPTHPSGRFVGTAKFLLRKGTKDGREDDKDISSPLGPGEEYLYEEEGEFTASNGLVFNATRKYVWRYVEQRDELSVWFTKEGKTGYEGKKADYLFHIVEFEGAATSAAAACTLTSARTERQMEPYHHSPASTGAISSEAKGWTATAGHLCIDDFYNVNYEFMFAGVNLKNWKIGYSVTGPKKSYSIDGIYSRPGRETLSDASQQLFTQRQAPRI